MAKRTKNSRKAAAKTPKATATKKPTPKIPAAAKSRAATRKPAQASTQVTHDQIAKRAYEIWMEQGKPAGTEHENWCQAKDQLSKI